MNGTSLIQLPDDTRSVGFRKSANNPFEFEQVFTSETVAFTGTELEFVKAGFGYAYQQIDSFTRRVIQP